jgi:biopolymer transport protein ExbD
MTEEEFDLPMTPLIDVIFLLIIFFLVTTTFIEHERDMSVTLPQSSEGEDSKELQNDLIINVREDGSIVIDGRNITREKLLKILFTAHSKNPNQIVIIRGDQSAYHKYVVSVMGACLRAGITNVSVAVEAAK